MPIFYTIFPLSMNVHLLKDVGMIPYVLFRDYGYDSTLVAFQNEANYFALEKEVKGLKIEYIESDSCSIICRCIISSVRRRWLW